MSNIKHNRLRYQELDLNTLEKAYSPSSCVDDIGVYIKQYIDLSDKAKKSAIEQGKLIANIQYGSNPDEVLDLFMPFKAAPQKRKLQVYIHGGYWQELSKDESCFAATNFQNSGYHFAVINYSLAPKASLTEIVEQNRQALIFLYQHADEYGYDKNEIYLSGSSAGGHLAMMMALTDWSKYIETEQNIVKGICAVSGIYDLTPIAQTYINEPLQLTEKEIANYSPLLFDTEKLSVPLREKEIIKHCAFIMAYGDTETSEFKCQTSAMIHHLTGQKIKVTQAEIAQRNHFNVILDLADAESWLSQQIFQQMKRYLN
ncbi:alpha/beta hydrolase [Thalassotalea sp. SU-HH00458]|uniref:alpha/beta hydrolase n=1 Tax=Thalassotalea sp. SU-HH00458 TaxID=3127657 RepID=UPI0031092923